MEVRSPAQHSRQDDDNPQPPRILIVDDDSQTLDVLSQLLEESDYAVTTCLDPTKALDILDKESFSVVISDQFMPRMDGLAFLTEAKKRQPNTARVLMTGIVTVDVTIDAINKGDIFRFLTKPWSNEDLMATVQNGINRFELLEENRRLQEHTQQLNAQLNANFTQSLDLCRRLIVTFSPLLGKCTEAVEQICDRFCQMDIFTAEEKEILRVSATLHNIGLLGVPRDILATALHRPKELSSEQLSIVENHPVYGQELAAFVGHLAGVGEVIRSHHERWDGSGYPDGLRESAIPRPARFLAVAAGYVESRYSEGDAVSVIVNGSGKAFSPEAVRAFMTLSENANLPRRVKEILPKQLRPGMSLAKPLHSPSGLLLVPEGHTLTRKMLERIKGHEVLDNVRDRLLVYV